MKKFKILKNKKGLLTMWELKMSLKSEKKIKNMWEVGFYLNMRTF